MPVTGHGDLRGADAVPCSCHGRIVVGGQAKYGLALNVGLDGPEGFDATLHGSSEEYKTLELTLGVELGVDHEGGRYSVC